MLLRPAKTVSAVDRAGCTKLHTHISTLAKVLGQPLVDFPCRRHPGLEQAAGGFRIRVAEGIAVRGPGERLHGGSVV